MKYLYLFLCFLILGCVLDPIENDNDVVCEVDSFIGEWEYHSSNGVVHDSIPDLLIEVSDDEFYGDILINGRYHRINAVRGCTAGEFSGVIELNFELVSTVQISRRTSIFYLFGSTDLYIKK